MESRGQTAGVGRLAKLETTVYYWRRTRGFASETTKNARNIRKENELSDEIERLTKENTLLRKMCDSFKEKVIELSEEVESLKISNVENYNLFLHYPFLSRHISSRNLKNESENSKNGNRFKDELTPIYILLSLSGEYYTYILHKHFGFPSSRICRK